MTRKLLRGSFLVMLILSIVLVAYAHSGRTDINGGHTNHKTGEYHYHHGYPEHDHYDMDGDGDIDCPYTYKGSTDNNQNNITSETKLSISEFPTIDHDSIPKFTYDSNSQTTNSHVKESSYEEDSKIPLILAGLLLAWIIIAPICFGRE